MILLVLAVAWLGGATLGALGYAAWWPAVLLGGCGLVLASAIDGRRGRAALVALAVAASLVSLVRFEAALPPSMPGGLAVHNGGDPVRLLGTIVSEPEERPTTQRFVVDIEAIEVGSDRLPIEGRVLVTQRLFPRYAYGDIVEFTAALETPPEFETFDYREYLARRGIASTALFPSMTVLSQTGGSDVKRVLIEARTPLGEALERTLPEPEAALARGILLGQRASIPEDVNEAFNAAGISHLIAISGYNVMLVAGAVTGATAAFLGRQRATVLAMVVVVAYAVFVGGSPSVLRAMLMALVMLGATLAGRPGNALTGVSLAGAGLVLWSPLIIEDVSFQLSFAATLGIVTLASPLREWLLQTLVPRLDDRLASMLADSLAVTTAASLAVTPIIASTFGRFSVVSLPANVLAAPVFGLALAGAFLTSVVGAIDDASGRALGEITYLPLHYLVWLANTASSVPLSTIAMDGFGVIGALVFFAVLGLMALALAGDKREVTAPGSLPRLGTAPVFAVAAIVVAVYFWWGALQPADRRLEVHVLDVGQGDAMLIEAPSGTRVLVDGGPGGALVTQALGDVLSPEERRIDLMVLTHAQDDHVTGLVEVLERYDVRGAL